MQLKDFAAVLTGLLVSYGKFYYILQTASGQFAPAGVKGKLYSDGTFVPGTTGADWTPPTQMDRTRVGGISDWTTTSWNDVSCCKIMNNPAVWDDPVTGVPDCFCKDVLIRSFYKTSSVCMLQQACENALKDWNKVFGEGYMVPGLGVELDTESPARTCKPDGTPCGVSNAKAAKTYKDPYGRKIAPGYIPSATYGQVKGQEIEPLSTTRDPVGYFNKIVVETWHWTPGDIPKDKVYWQGYTANDGKVEFGLMSNTPVYPGQNLSTCCLYDANSTCCRESALMRWKGPINSLQADCMFAVKRAICAYHFWECDASLPDEMYNGVCEHTCGDIPNLCGTIPSTGQSLDLSQFTLGGYYHLGCTKKTREYVKDCTASALGRARPAVICFLLSIFVLSFVCLINNN